MAAQLEIKILIEDFENKNRQMDEIVRVLDDLLKKIPGSEKLLKIKGVGIKTVTGFLAEVGDVRRFTNAKQVQKYCRLVIQGKQFREGRRENENQQKRSKETALFVVFGSQAACNT